MAEIKSVDRSTFEAVRRLLADHPELDIDGLRAMVEQPARRRRRADKIRPSARELVDLVAAALLAKSEAKRYLDVPGARR